MYDVQVLEVGVSSITVADYRKGCVVDVTYLYSEGLGGRFFYKARLPVRKKWVKDEKLVGLLQKLLALSICWMMVLTYLASLRTVPEAARASAFTGIRGGSLSSAFSLVAFRTALSPWTAWRGLGGSSWAT